MRPAAAITELAVAEPQGPPPLSGRVYAPGTACHVKYTYSAPVTGPLEICDRGVWHSVYCCVCAARRGPVIVQCSSRPDAGTPGGCARRARARAGGHSLVYRCASRSMSACGAAVHSEGSRNRCSSLLLLRWWQEDMLLCARRR